MDYCKCMLTTILISIAIENVIANSGASGTLYRWKQIDFEFPTPEEREGAIRDGRFIQSSVIPLGIERWKERIFITTPRWKKGVPATLSVLPVQNTVQSPLLKPYPHWNWQTGDNCTTFTSVFRMNVDPCGVMWVLDAGQVEAFETPRQLCPPAIIAIDLETDTVLGRYPIPDQYVLQDSLITNIVVDTRQDNCKDLHLYIADARRFGLIVFRASDAAFWKFSHYTFFPEPLLSNYTISGVNFQWSDGLFGMSLGRIQAGDRPLFYHSMSGSYEFVVSTSVVRDPARINDAVGEFKLLGESRGPRGQVSASAVDRNGVMFFNLVSLESIGCWDTQKPYSIANIDIVAHNSNTLIFPNDLRIDHHSPQYAWIITNRLPFYQANMIDPNEFNFRIVYLDLTKAIENTVCQPYNYEIVKPHYYQIGK